MAFSTACLAGCGDSVNEDGDGQVSKPGGSISGSVSVLPQETRTSFVEQEPNDTLNDAGAPITVLTQTRLEIFGSLSTLTGDLSDSFQFQIAPNSALTVQAILFFDFNPQDPTENDFGLGISDFQSSACTLGADAQFFAQCVNTEKNPEVTTFEVNGNFGLTIQALSGTGSYVLGLEFQETAAGTTTRGSAIRFPSRRRTQVSHQDAHPQRAFVPAQLLVKFERHLSNAQCTKILKSRNLDIVQSSPSGTFLCRLDEHKQISGGQASRPIARAVSTMRQIEALRTIEGVRVVEPNYRYFPVIEPNDEHFALQWHYALINLPEAWDITTGTNQVTIAVVDTGVLGDHPDFGDRLMPGFDFISDPESAGDGDGIDDDPTDEGDLSGGPGNSSYHGTHVTGTLGAATNNGLDVAAVTWDCNILPLRALGVGGGSTFDIAEAIRYAARIPNVSGLLPAEPADVINLSIATAAGSSPSVLMGDAITEAVAKGVVVVAAAGNDGSSLKAYPGGFDDSISVAACDPQLNLAPYSNFGSSIDLAAPGGDLAVDLTGDGFGDGVLSLLGFETPQGIEFTLSFQHGTSMATPHVSGVVALMKSANPLLTVTEIREILSSTAIDVGAVGDDDVFGAGILNAAGAVNEAAARAGQETLADPRVSLSTNFLDFSSTLDQLSVQLTNTGGGILNITDVTAEEFNAAGWLGVVALSSSGNTNVSGLVVTVDRTGLAEGRYVGRITVVVAGDDDQIVDVEMRVGQNNVIQDQLFVVAVDSETRVTIGQDVTSAERGFAFEITGLPAGSYKIYAGTDRDNDDQICDLGELCGGFPSAILANEIELTDQGVIADLNFPVGEIIFEAQPAQRVKHLVIERLDWALD